MFRAHEMPFKQITGIASAEIARYSFVALATDGTVVPAQPGKFVVGVARQEARVGQEVTILVHGVSFVNSGIKLVPGDVVTAGADGVVAKATEGQTSNMVVMVGCEANEVASILVK